MKRCMITITTLLEDNTRPTLVLDISQQGVSVNCPKSSGIEIESSGSESQFELHCKMPDGQEELYFLFKDLFTGGAFREGRLQAA